MKPAAVARMFGVTTPTLLRWARRGDLIRCGNTYRRDSVEQLAVKRGLLPNTNWTVDVQAEVIYPEHEKVVRHKVESQAAGEFLEWLTSEAGYSLVTFDHRGRALMVNKSVGQLLAQWLNIDTDRLEAEKQAMLDRICEENS